MKQPHTKHKGDVWCEWWSCALVVFASRKWTQSHESLRLQRVPQNPSITSSSASITDTISPSMFLSCSKTIGCWWAQDLTERKVNSICALSLCGCVCVSSVLQITLHRMSHTVKLLLPVRKPIVTFNKTMLSTLKIHCSSITLWLSQKLNVT